MKKFLTLLLAIVMVFAMAIPAFAEPENFLTDPKWDKGTAGGVTYKDGIATGTGFRAQYCCPSVDILPAVKAALGDEDEVEIAIVFDARINFIGGESNSSEAVMLLRGTNGISGLGGIDNVDAWLEAYDESLDGEDRLFTNSKGNILKYCSNNIEITDEWQTYSTNLFVYAAQVNNPSVIKWNFTLDKFTAFEDFESIEIRNIQVVLADEAEDLIPEEEEEDPVEEPEVKPDENKPEENKPEENKPVATQKPQVQVPTGNETIAPEVTAPADSENTDAPAENNSCNVDTNTILIVAAACSLVIIIACVVAIIVVKKKTTK